MLIIMLVTQVTPAPMPVAETTATATRQVLAAAGPLTSATVEVSAVSADTMTSGAVQQQLASSDKITSSGVHQQPGHACPTCGPLDSLPPWRRRLIDRQMQVRPKEDF